MSFHYFLRRASMMRSIRSLRPYQLGTLISGPDVENRGLGRVVGGQFPTLIVRFLTAHVHQTAPPINEVAEEIISTKTDERINSTKSTDHVDGLDSLPFEITEGGPEHGYITLKRKYKDEIIEIKVRPYYYDVTTYYSDTETDISNADDEEELVEAETEGNNEVDQKGELYTCEVKEALKLLAVAEKNHGVTTSFKDKILGWKDRGDVKHLYVLVKIHFGIDYKECLKFYIVVYPHNKFHIRSMSRRVNEDKGSNHLEDYEQLFKQRVFEPSKLKLNLVENFNFLLKCFNFGRSENEVLTSTIQWFD